MAERRKKKGSALLHFGSKSDSMLIEAFPAELWPNAPDADAGLFRICINGRMWMPGRKKYAFVTADALGQLIAREITEHGTLERYESRRPGFRKGDTVRWRPDEEGLPTIRAKLMSDPVMWVDGVWRALIVDIEAGTRLVACDEFTLLNTFGREICRWPDQEDA